MKNQNQLIQALQEKYTESQEAEERAGLVEQQISELSDFSKSLEEINKSKEKDMLASLGKGVYIPAEIKEKTLYVGIGSGYFVRKSPQETEAVIKNQVKGLEKMSHDLKEIIGKLNKEMQNLMQEIEDKRES